MKKNFMILLLSLFGTCNVFAADAVSVDYEIGETSDNFILLNADINSKSADGNVVVTNKILKYYLNATEDGDRLTQTIYFDETTHGNIYVHSFAIFWEGAYYQRSAQDSPDIVYNNWRGGTNTTSTNVDYKTTESTDVYWITLSDDTTNTSKSAVLKLPYVSGLHIEGYATSRAGISVRFYKNAEDVVTAIDDVDATPTVVARYDLYGRVVDENYQGVVIEKFSNGKARKVIY